MYIYILMSYNCKLIYSTAWIIYTVYMFIYIYIYYMCIHVYHCIIWYTCTMYIWYIMNLIAPCCTCCSSLQGVKKREQASLMAWRLIFPLQIPKKVITSIPVVSKRCKDHHRNPLDSVPPAVCSDSPRSRSCFCQVPSCRIHSEFTPHAFQDPFTKRLSISFQAWKVALQKSQFHNKRSIQIQVFPVLQWTSTGTHLVSANSSLHALGSLGRWKTTQLADPHLPKWSKYYKVGPGSSYKLTYNPWKWPKING